MNFLILTGGENRRIGGDKAGLKIGRHCLLERVILQVDKARRKGERIILVGKKPSLDKRLSGKVEWVEDVFSGRGPLGGIYSGLFFSNEEFNFVLGCDMPFLQGEFIDYMRRITPHYHVLLPSHTRGMEPLHAIYSKYCLPVIRERLERGENKIQGIFSYLKVKFVEEKEIKRFSPPWLLFFNVNTPDDLKKARKLVAKEKSLLFWNLQEYVI